MGYITQKVRERNAYRAEITLVTVDSMFEAVSDLLNNNDRHAQLSWVTEVGRLRKIVVAQRNAPAVVN
jgi:hypothetical protein